MRKALLLGILFTFGITASAQASSSWRPVLTVKGTTLEWTSTSILGHYYLREEEPGLVRFLKVPGNTLRSKTPATYKPKEYPGHTVTYEIRPGQCKECWSNEVAVSWPTVNEEPPKEEKQEEPPKEEKHEEPPKEEPPKEEPPKEESKGIVVNSTPTGPPSPPSGWAVEFADSFADPFGTGPGQDPFWKANSNARGCCNNGNEIASESPSEVHLGPNGLELLCVNSAGYVCSGVDTLTENGFNWKPGGGQEWAFEVVMKLPPRDLGEDPGWWSTDHSWTDELDFLEGWEWEHEEYFAGIPVWKAKTPNIVEVAHEAYKLKTEIPNPETEFHRYTTVVKANNEEEEYIDGVHRWNVRAPSSLNTPWMHLILTHALRVSTNMLGSSSFDIRSVAVYEDKGQAGQNTEHGGVAPGTVVK